MAIRLFQEKAQIESKTIALIFVDAMQFLYGIIRIIVSNVVETDQAVIMLFEQLKIPPEAMEE